MTTLTQYAKVLAALLPAFFFSAAAQASAEAGIKASEAWARMTPMSGALYVTLTNNGTGEETLQRIECPGVARHVELHTTEMEDDVMRMRAVPSLTLGPGQEISMSPGGMHIMLMALEAKHSPGEQISCVLHFDNSGPVKLSAEIRPLGK